MEAKRDVARFVSLVLDELSATALTVSDLAITEDFTKATSALEGWEVQEVPEKVEDE